MSFNRENNFVQSCNAVFSVKSVLVKIYYIHNCVQLSESIVLLTEP